MHITTKPVARVELDNEQRDYNVTAQQQLVAHTPNPFEAVRAAIMLEQHRFSLVQFGLQNL